MLWCNPKIRADKIPATVGPATPVEPGVPALSRASLESWGLLGKAMLSLPCISPTGCKFAWNSKLNMAHLNFYFYNCRESQESQDWM